MLYLIDHFVNCSKQTILSLAGTTEKVFEEKTKLHDIYVDNQNVTAHSKNLTEMKRINAMDKDKFNRLNSQRCDPQLHTEGPGGRVEQIDDDHIFAT